MYYISVGGCRHHPLSTAVYPDQMIKKTFFFRMEDNGLSKKRGSVLVFLPGMLIYFCIALKTVDDTLIFLFLCYIDNESNKVNFVMM